MNVATQLLEPYIKTRKNRKVEFINPKAEQIEIDDIAWHLARTCRFNSHIDQWYSNAEHCILGARKASSPLVAKFFLLHDAAEYVFGDLVSPVKRLVPNYKELIENFQNFLYKHYVGSADVPDEVHEIDARITATEMVVLRENTEEDVGALVYPDIKFRCWDWEIAYSAFLSEFNNLFAL